MRSLRQSDLIVPQTQQQSPASAPSRYTEASPRWPERILELSRQLRRSPEAGDREHTLGELWTVVHLVLQSHARTTARLVGVLDSEDVRDMVADKAMDLIGRVESGSWDPALSSASELESFLAGVARHGVIDLLRARRRQVRFLYAPSPGWVGRDVTQSQPSAAWRRESVEHADAILECCRQLTQKARIAWFLRVFHEFSSSEIARHPDVASTSIAVDAMLMRCRKLMSACMKSKGFDPARMPPGTFTRLWEILMSNKGGTEE